LRSEAIKTIGSRKTFAGQADDPFFLDLAGVRPALRRQYRGQGIHRDRPRTRWRITTSTRVALKVPLSDLALNNNATRNPVVGIWSTTLAKSADGSFAQVSRLGNPLVNEVVVPVCAQGRLQLAARRGRSHNPCRRQQGEGS